MVRYTKVPQYVQRVFKPKTVKVHIFKNKRINYRFLKIIHCSNNRVTSEKSIICLLVIRHIPEMTDGKAMNQTPNLKDNNKQPMDVVQSK